MTPLPLGAGIADDETIINDTAPATEAMIREMVARIRRERAFANLDPYVVAQTWAIGRIKMRELRAAMRAETGDKWFLR